MVFSLHFPVSIKSIESDRLPEAVVTPSGEKAILYVWVGKNSLKLQWILVTISCLSPQNYSFLVAGMANHGIQRYYLYAYLLFTVHLFVVQCLKLS